MNNREVACVSLGLALLVFAYAVYVLATRTP